MAIKKNSDVIPHQLALIDKLEKGQIDPRLAHAINGTLSRVMYNIHATIRYNKARDTKPYIAFMHDTASDTIKVKAK